jgi:hypothetical protein
MVPTCCPHRANARQSRVPSHCPSFSQTLSHPDTEERTNHARCQ